MAKEKQEQVKPVVTSLPLPASDSVLVIDLPDGQKLLVGKMPSGSVIEVATWRGTGRPDSRTNRLMLGMSNGEIQNQDEVQAESSTNVSRSLSLAYAIYLLRNTYVLLHNFLAKQLGRLKDFKWTRRKSSDNSPKQDSVDEDVEAWLKQITQKAQTSTTPKAEEPKKSPGLTTKTPIKRKASPKKVAGKTRK